MAQQTRSFKTKPKHELFHLELNDRRGHHGGHGPHHVNEDGRYFFIYFLFILNWKTLLILLNTVCGNS